MRTVTEQAILRWEPRTDRISIRHRSPGASPACTKTVGERGKGDLSFVINHLSFFIYGRTRLFPSINEK
jgi:hypothetical protein